VLLARQTPTHASDGAGAVCDRIANEVRALLAESSRGAVGVGIGSPGFVDGDRGVVRTAVNLAWTELPLANEIRRRLDGLPVFVENDANVIALGEGRFGAAAGSQHYVLLTIGSGLGSGVVSHGRLITGAHWMAADLGHYAIDPDQGRACACGHRGCAETVVSGPGLVAVARDLLRERPAAGSLADVTELAPDVVLTAARRGDEVAREAVTKLARWLGHVAAVAAAVTEPDVIVIGGGLGTAAFDLIVAVTEQELLRRVPPAYRRAVRVRRATVESSAVGAACLVWSRLASATARPAPPG
jgi:glucokinase